MAQSGNKPLSTSVAAVIIAVVVVAVAAMGYKMFLGGPKPVDSQSTIGMQGKMLQQQGMKTMMGKGGSGAGPPAGMGPGTMPRGGPPMGRR